MSSREREYVYHGDLETTPLPAILATINRYGVPGVLEVARSDITKRVYLLDGDIIFATSTDRRESLGDFMVERGVLSKEDLEASIHKLSGSEGLRHGEIMVQMGLIEADQLGIQVRKQVQAIVWSLFNWTSGRVTFEVGPSKEDEVFKIKIPTARAIVAGCRVIEDPKMITARMGGRGAVLKRLTPPPHLNSFRLESDERELLELIDGKRTLYELCEAGPLNPGANARVLYALAELQLITVDPSSSGKLLIQVRG
jgi:hypothetical protein